MLHLVKKHLSALLALILISSCVQTSVIASDEHTYETEIQFLKDVHILNHAFTADLEVTRADMAVFAVALLHTELDFTMTADSAPVFFDVTYEHPHYSELRAAKALGIINGDSANRFRPNELASVTDAIIILVNALGYTPRAIAYGGYPFGFQRLAKELGISKGVDIASEGGLTGGQAAKLMYNALFADLLLIDSVQSGNIIVKSDPQKNILSERLGIKEYDAVLINDGFIALEGSSAPDPQKVVLKDAGSGNYITAYVGDTDINSYLGNRLKVFIRLNDNTGRNEVVFFTIHSQAKELIIFGDQVKDAGANYIRYEKNKDSGNLTGINFRSAETYVFYNGKHMVGYAPSIFHVQDGIIKCIDNDSNGVYEAIMITSFNYRNNNYNAPSYNIVTDSVDLENSLIYCRFNQMNNLSLSDPEANYRFIYSGNVRSLSDLKPNMVVSVAQCPELIDGKLFYFLVASSEKEEGIIESYSADSLTINGNLYNISSSVLSVKPSFTELLNLKNHTEILLDGAGRIAYVSGTAASKNYAYMINAALRETIDAGVMIKIFTKDGEFLTPELSPKAVIDGKVISADSNGSLGENQLKALSKEYSGYEKFPRPGDSKMPEDDDLYGRPIIYTLDSQNRVIRIDTETPNELANENTTRLADQTPLRYSDEEIDDPNALKAGFRSPRTNRYRPNNRSLEGKFMMTTDTVIIHVPKIDLWGLESFKTPGVNVFNNQGSLAFNYDIVKSFENEDIPEQYYLMRVSEFSGAYQYDIQAFDVDPDTGIADFAVVRGAPNVYFNGAVSTSITYPTYVFLRSAQIYDSSLEKTITKLYYTRYGDDEISAAADTDSMLFYYRYLINGVDGAGNMYNGKEVPPIERGDLVRVLQSDGYVTHIERVVQHSRIKQNYSSNVYPSIPRYGYQQALYSGTGGPDYIPFDVRQYDGGQVIYTVAPKALKGNNLTFFCGFPLYSSINIENKSSYTELHVEMGVAPVVTVTKDGATGEIKVRPGTPNDIKTYQEARSIELSSILVLKLNIFKTEQVFVFNGF